MEILQTMDKVIIWHCIFRLPILWVYLTKHQSQEDQDL